MSRSAVQPMHTFYTADPRVLLIPIEHLSPNGVSPPFAAWLGTSCAWPPAAVELLDRGFALYWTRLSDLSACSPFFLPPRLRNIAVVAAADPLAVHPLAQLLNTSTWTLHASDFDPERSHAELVAYLLVHGERLAVVRDVTVAALHCAAYWRGRDADERAAFAAAARLSTRPDAALLREIAGSFAWFDELHHEVLRPIPGGRPYRSVPGSGVQVPAAIDERPLALVRQNRAVAQECVAAYHRRWRAPDLGAVRRVCEWLEGEAPPLLVTGAEGRILWDPDHPERLGPLRTQLRSASGAGVRDVRADLEVVARQTRRFLGSLVRPADLPVRPAGAEQRGYVYMHAERRLIAYNLHEPGIERLRGPAIPYARPMLGARTVHEWCHLAVDARWVDAALEPDESVRDYRDLVEQFALSLDGAPPELRELALREFPGSDLHAVAANMATLLLSRMPDFAANLLAQRFLDDIERETYVRQNIRTLRFEFGPERRWHLLVRYLYEYQYLRFSFVPDKREYFLRSTWFDADFFATGMLTEERFDRLAAAVGRICDSFRVDENRFRSFGGEDEPPPAA